MRGSSLPKLVPVLENRKHKGELKKNDNFHLHSIQTPAKNKEFSVTGDQATPQDIFEREPNPGALSNPTLRMSGRTSGKEARAEVLTPAVVNLANPNLNDIRTCVITESDEDDDHREKNSGGGSIGTRHNSLKVISEITRGHPMPASDRQSH